MPRTKKTKSGRAGASEPHESKGGLGTVLKWVGGGTAVLSLIFGLRQLTVLISDVRDRQRQVTELIATGPGSAGRPRTSSLGTNSPAPSGSLRAPGCEVGTAVG